MPSLCPLTVSTTPPLYSDILDRDRKNKRHLDLSRERAGDLLNAFSEFTFQSQKPTQNDKPMPSTSQLHLENAAAAAAKSRWLGIPPRGVREAVRPGTYAKLSDGPASFLWVIVEAAKSGHYAGRVVNKFVFGGTRSAEGGEEIRFTADHVFDIAE